MGLWAQGFGKTEPKWQFIGKFFFAQYADDAHRCALMRIRCASADASAWPTLTPTDQYGYQGQNDEKYLAERGFDPRTSGTDLS